jgi:dTDP-4-dehydrorhamnose 3,5-epimerase
MLTVTATQFSEAKLITPDVHSDARGYFKETYSRRTYEAIGIRDVWLQDSVSRSARNVLRGMHYDMRMAKLVEVLEGAVFDVIVDMREASPTFKKWQSFSLTGDSHLQLYVPRGFAHGFLALSDTVIFHYKMSAMYDPAQERLLKWNDPSVGIAWPLEGAPILSPKDA